MQTYYKYRKGVDKAEPLTFYCMGGVAIKKRQLPPGEAVSLV